MEMFPFIRLPIGFVRLLKRTMSPEAGFSGFVETGRAAAADAHPRLKPFDNMLFDKVAQHCQIILQFLPGFFHDHCGAGRIHLVKNKGSNLQFIRYIQR